MAQQTEDKSNEQSSTVLQPPAVPPPRKISKPKITLKIPPLSPQLPPFFTTATPGIMTIPMTPGTGLPQNYPVSYVTAYPNKAQEFMFKQFEGFKDFTMSTGKLGLSFGEKTAFWMYGKMKQWSKNGFTHIFLFLVVMLYCALGGFIFYVLEKSNDDQLVRKYDGMIKERVRQAIANVNGLIGPQLGNDSNKRVLRYVKKEFEGLAFFFTENPHVIRKEKWDAISSIYFCGTIFTTIGYGHMAPVTTLGRIACIVYSLFGIPMFLILLADYGKLFTRGIKFLWAFVRRIYYTGSCRKVRRTVPVQEMMKGVQLVYDMTKRKGSQDVLEQDIAKPAERMKPSPTGTPALSTYTIDDQFNLPISVAFGVLIIYMICGACFFGYTEDWKFFDSLYFVYISISTIGFGDIVPKSQVVLMLISLVYFVFGLALTSMLINVIQEKLSDSFQQATAKIGATIGFQVPEEGNVNAPYQVAYPNEGGENNTDQYGRQ